MSESKRELAIRMLKENACMFNSCLAKDELKHFKNYDFVQYLINCLSIPEHNYDNCHNSTCRRMCRKDGYEHAIDDFVKYIDECSGWTPNCIEHDISLTVYTLHQIADELKSR